jgi:hypothetical protein
MTARQRPASGSAALPATVSANGASNGAATAFHWEAWFAGATPDQRAEALALAREQGLLYLHQLPANAPQQRGAATAANLVPLLSRLLVGKADGLPALSEEPITWVDPQLDPMQREAVRRALNTPDLFLLHGLPGTGKSRVVAEVIVQAARRGWRVLLLGPTTPAVDVVLGRLATCADVLPIRLLAADEAVEKLSRALQALTLAEQRRAFRDRTLAGARQARAQAEQTCASRQREEALWPRLPVLGAKIQAMQDRLDTLEQRATELATQVEHEASGGVNAGSGLSRALAEVRQRSAAAMSEWTCAQAVLGDQVAAAHKERADIAGQLAALERRCRARQERRWWTIGFWTGASALRDRESLQGRHAVVDAALRKLEESHASHESARQQIEAKEQAERQDCIRAEVDCRRQELTAQLATARRELERGRGEWQALLATLQPAELLPNGYTQADIDAARARWQQQRECDDANCQFARQWADYLDQAGEQLAPRLPALANLVAGPIAAVTQGRDWQEASATPFDLLIVEEAEHLTESELLRLVVHAPRLMVVGQVWRESVPAGPVAAKGPRSLPGLQPAAVCWPRLTQALADDLARLPYAWQHEGERLVCHLAAVRADETRYLEREVLADAPEIELHILNRPRAKPVLARVSFPGSQTIPQATRFIYRELEELPIQPLGRTAWWQATGDGWLLHLGPAPLMARETVELNGGVRMELIAAGQPYAGRAACLAFARATFADRSTAERWLHSNLHWHDRERSVFLQVPHRMHRPLAEVVGPLLFPDACLASLLAAHVGGDPLFEFVPVPLPRRPEWPREGAGLEQDLATGRHGDRLPSELRGELPRKGIVNYLEAQALVRRLEQWTQAPSELTSNGKGAPAVLVLALYEAQAELLRRLVARSPLLQARAFALEIAVPGQVRQRECEVLVLSLTRSHAHRCVPLGEDAADLALALTRSRRRILVFGDIGTLMKRTQWQGPLDHLDAPDAHVEGLRVGRLLRHVQSLPSMAATASR